MTRHDKRMTPATCRTCSRPRRRDRLLCPRCSDLVPYDLGRAVDDEYRPQARVQTAAYFQAAGAVVRFINDTLDAPPGAEIDPADYLVVNRSDLEREEVFEAVDLIAPGAAFTYRELCQVAAAAGRPIRCLGSMLRTALREAVAAGQVERAGRDWTRTGGPNLYRKPR